MACSYRTQRLSRKVNLTNSFGMVSYPRGNQTGQPDSSRVLQTIKLLPPMASKYETTSLKANKKDIITS
ncbi:hypothetical protein PHMEG_00019764 [Phytophthora megakarya]|uniref:Uncharacterized protein n=1 Tax=Phytophthora megakarya TaxID=4795 RepID=A0A225VRN5_9STRA|nr:hypothetical protein PHMEG_00019764 [Phytophthora megakarya]